MTSCSGHGDRGKRAAEITSLRAQGLTAPAIAERLGVSRSRIYQIMAAELVTAEDRAVWTRFAMLPSDLAARLAHRFHDAAAVCAASDDELLSLRGLGPRQLQKVRQRYPHRATSSDEALLSGSLLIHQRRVGLPHRDLEDDPSVERAPT